MSKNCEEFKHFDFQLGFVTEKSGSNNVKTQSNLMIQLQYSSLSLSIGKNLVYFSVDYIIKDCLEIGQRYK